MKSTPSTAIQHVEKTDRAAELLTRGCAVCNHVIKITRDFLSHWQYGLASDEKAQSQFAGELGFCPTHMWQLHEMSSSWGESIGLPRLFEHISELVDRAEPWPVEQIIRTPQTCRICKMLREAEAVYVADLRDFLSDASGRECYSRCSGVCLRHLGQLLAISPHDLYAFLRRETSKRFRIFAAEMYSYAAKREALRRDLISANEENASLNALIHIASAKDHSAP
jgi:hypothetical protein